MVQVRARSQVGFGWVDSQKTQVWLWGFYFESKKSNSGQVLASYWVQYTGRTRPKPLLKIIVLQVCS